MKRWLFVIALLIAAVAGLLWWLQSEPVVATALPPETNQVTEAPPPPHAEAASQVTLRVHVIDALGRDVEGAQVYAQGRAQHLGVSDARGRWSLEFSADDAQLIRAERDGLVSATVGPVSESTEVELTLQSVTQVSCDVVDATSHALVDAAKVAVLGRAYSVTAGQVGLPLVPALTPLTISAPGYLTLETWFDFSRPSSRCQLPLERLSRVEGVVVDNGVPVSSVVVWAESVGMGSARTAFVQTNGNGEFSIQAKAGLFRLVGNTRSGLRVDGPPFALAAGEVKKGLTLELGARAPLSGTLTHDGVALAAAEVALVNAQTEQQVSATQTGPGGQYQFHEASPGKYVLQVRRGAFGGIAGPIQHTEMSTHFDFDFKGTNTATVRGRVEPASTGVRVRCRDAAWAGSARDAVTDAQGRFVFEGVSGRVFIDAQGPAGAATTTAVPGDDVVLRLSANPLVVHVRDAQGQPVTEALVFSQNGDTGALRTDTLMAPSGDLPLSLPRGFWLISAQVRTGLKTASARVDLQGPMEVTVSLPPGATVRSTVVDVTNKLPIANAAIALFANGSGQQSPMVMTDARGEFSLVDIDVNGALTVSRDGYTRAGFRVRDVPPRIELTPNPQATAAQPPFQYEGVGMVLEVRAEAVAVKQVYEGSPAQRAGALADDLIRAVDGAPATLPVESVVNRIRGAAGSAVTVTLERNGRTFDVVMRRRAFVL